MNEQKNIPSIYGSGGGKGGGGGGAVEAPNTLQSDTIVRVLEVISEGEIDGIVGGLKGVYFDNTPIQTADGTNNYENISIELRNGLPDQEYMAGFPAAETIHDFGAEFTTSTSFTYTVSDAEIDAVKVTITLPNGLSEQNTSNGNLNGSTVTFAIDTASQGGVYSMFNSYTIEGKTTSSFGRTYRVERPGTTGLWSIRVRRITDDATKSNIRNQTSVGGITEIQDVKLPYNDIAYAGVAVSAKAVGGRIPNRAYLTRGIKCRVPSNYNPETGDYTGIWAGDFKLAWTNNPAWILFDLLTNSRYGMGDYVNENEIDLYSFYDAGVYNDQFVYDGKGGVERRFTFNTQIMNQEDAVKVIQQIAGTFNAILLREGPLYRLQQDRPASPVRILTNSNVLNGSFNIVETPIQSRRTVVNAKYIDKNNFYKTQITTVTAGEDKIERYGYIETDIECFGVTSEGQAIRNAKWFIETELNQTKIARFQMSFNGFNLRLGDIVSIWDEDFTGTVASGRLLSVTPIDSAHATIVFDRPVAIPAYANINYSVGDEILTGICDGGVTTSTTVITFTSGGTPPKEGSVFFVNNAVKPMQFRITKINQSDTNVLDIEALQHDPSKYDRIEQGVTIEAPIYSGISTAKIQPVTNITFSVIGYVSDEGVRRDLAVAWQPPVNADILYYTFQYRRNGGNWESARAEGPSYEIQNINEGIFDVRVITQSLNGTSSIPATATYTFTLSGGTGSALSAVTGLAVANIGGTTWSEKDLSVQWTNPSSNEDKGIQLKDFRVDVKDSSDNIIRTEYVDRVAASQTQKYTYSYEKNQLDGGLRRTLKVTVYCRDTDNRLSAGTTTTFTNPVPVAPTVEVKAGVKSLMIETSRPVVNDYAGTIIWGSTSADFAIGDATKLYQGSNTFYILENVTNTYYFKAAHYDSLGTTGLEISSRVSGTPSSAGGITTVASLPANPDAVGGQQAVFLDVADTAARGLYGWSGTAWVRVNELADGSVTKAKLATGLQPVEIVATLPTSGNYAGRVVFLSSDSKLYRHNGTSWSAAVPTSDLTGQITTTQITDNAITTAKVAANAITAGQIAANTITAGQIAADTITSGQIAAGAITADEIASNAVISSKILAGAVTADKITVNSLSAINANMGSITAGNITLDQTGYIRGGATAFATGSGFWQGYDSTAYKWRVGTPGSSRAEWNGSSFNVYDASGNLTISSGVVDYSKVSGAPTSLSSINSTEGTKLAGISENAGAVVSLVNAGGMSITGNTVKKTAATGAYDSGFYSKDGYVGGAYVSWVTPSATEVYIIGLNTDPATDPNYTSIDYGLLCNSDGKLYAYESGNQQGASLGTRAANDVFAVTYDGTTIRYYQNGNILRSVAVNITAKLYADSSFATPNAIVKNIQFGPLSSNNWSAIGGTGKPQDNATVGANSTNLTVGLGANLLYNAGLNLSNDGWWGYPNAGRNQNGWNIAQGGSRYGTFVLFEDGFTGGGAMYIDGANKVPVVPGQRYELSIYTGAHRCRIAIGVDFWDANGNYLGGGNNITLVNGGENNEEQVGGSSLSSYKRIGMFVTAPANAATSRFLCWKNETKPGYTNSYLFACLPYYGVAGAGQTELSPWSEGSSSINTQINSNNVSTYISNAAIGAAQVGSISLVGTNNFNVASATSGERMTMDNQVIKIYDSAGVLRVKLGNLGA